MATEFCAQLEEIKNKCLTCEKCNLCKTRTNIVFSGGVPNSKLMLIGEAPGYYEDQKGEPFVGKAGQLLDKILGCVGFSREKDIYICNTVYKRRYIIIYISWFMNKIIVTPSFHRISRRYCITSQQYLI